jgi:hypothetical protein
MSEPRGPQFDDQKTPAEASSQDADDELIRRFTAWDRLLEAKWSNWQEEAKQAYDFVAGHQWEPTDRAALEENNKIPVVFNITAPTLDAVAGAEIQNRQEVMYYPREVGDQGISDALTQGAQYISDESNGDQEDSEAFYDTLICGCGWTGSHPELNGDDVTLTKERVDPLQMKADASARKPNFEDARYLKREIPMAKEDFEDWMEELGQPEVTAEGMNAADDAGKRLTIVNPQLRYTSGMLGQAAGVDEVVVCEWQWWDREPVYLAPLPSPQDANVVKVGKLGADEFQQALQVNPNLPHTRSYQKVYYRALVANNTIIFQETMPEACFRYKAITGKRDRNKGIWFGLVRPMLDPQRFTNKLYSEILHIVRTNANGGLTMEEDAVADIRKFEQTWAAADKITWVKPGSLSNAQGPKIQPKQPVPINPSLFQMMEFARDMVKACTGVNEEILGIVGRDQPGVLEAQRKQAAYGILSAFFDAKRRYQRDQGRLLLAQMRVFLPPDKLVRIVDKGTAQYVPLALTLEAQEYDVVVDEAPAGPNAKAKVMQVMLPLIPELFQAQVIGPQEVAMLIPYLDIPASVATQLQTSIMQRLQQAQQPNPQAQAQQQAKDQAAQMGVQAELQNKQADTQKKLASAAKDRASAAGQGMKAQAETFKAQASVAVAQAQAEEAKHKANAAAVNTLSKAQQAQNKQAQAEAQAQAAQSEANLGPADRQAPGETWRKAPYPMWSPKPGPEEGGDEGGGM